MINNFKIEEKLGLRLYSGGSSSGSGQQLSKSSGSSSGTSTSTSHPQMTPQQLLSLYNTALPQMLSTATTAANKSSPALGAANQGAVAGVNAVNMNGLSPGESNAIERSTNQGNLATGNLGNSNALNTIKNAVNFGGAFNSKLPLLNQSTNAASTAAGANAGSLAATTGVFGPIGNNATSPIQASNSLMNSMSSGTGIGASNNSSFNMGCFLTTACCQYKGLPDDCEELTVLRKFRETFVSKPVIDEYERIAPRLAAKIIHAPFMCEYVYSTVKDCVDLIKEEKNREALIRYTQMVKTLEKIYGTA